MSRVYLPAPAKLNLFLHITGRRPDGYHLLQTCFQLLDYGDRLGFEILDTPDIQLYCQLPALQTEDNLVLRAARLLQQYSGCRQGAAIQLEKVLPAGGGLGGGSSDAATTLHALNRLWGCGASTEDLARLGLTLGADVPVFVHGHSGWAEGVGEKLQALSLPAAWYLVLTPPCQVSTREIFSHQQLTRNSAPIKIPGFPISGSRNDCEGVARLLYPEIGAALNWLAGHAPARMTGTGASVFAAFPSQQAAETVLQARPEQLSGFVARAVNRSPLLDSLDRLPAARSTDSIE